MMQKTLGIGLLATILACAGMSWGQSPENNVRVVKGMTEAVDDLQKQYDACLKKGTGHACGMVKELLDTYVAQRDKACRDFNIEPGKYGCP